MSIDYKMIFRSAHFYYCRVPSRHKQPRRNTRRIHFRKTHRVYAIKQVERKYEKSKVCKGEGVKIY